MKNACSSSKLFPPLPAEEKNVRLFCSACRKKHLCVFALPVEEKACDVSLCLSRKRAARAHGSLFPLPVEKKAIMGAWRALAISFSSCLSKKSLSRDPSPRKPKSGLLRRFWTTAWPPSERFFTVRDKEKKDCELLVPLRDGLFLLPVGENAISELLRPELNLSANRKLFRSESSQLENRLFLVSRDVHL